MRDKDLIQIPLDLDDLIYKGTFIDVRSCNEFIHGHIEGAKNIPFEQIKESINSIKKMTKPLIFYSENGTRSERACNIVNDYISEVYNGGSFKKLENLLKSFSKSPVKDKPKRIRISSPPKNIRDFYK